MRSSNQKTCLISDNTRDAEHHVCFTLRCVVVVIKRRTTKAERNDFSPSREIAQALRHARSTTSERFPSDVRSAESMQIDFFPRGGCYRRRRGFGAEEERRRIILRAFSITIRVTGDFYIHAPPCNELAKCTFARCAHVLSYLKYEYYFHEGRLSPDNAAAIHTAICASHFVRILI